MTMKATQELCAELCGMRWPKGSDETVARAVRALTDLQMENARLREAAAPLAHEAAYWDGTQSGAPEAPDDNLVHVRLNDLRALHRALGPNP